jgi:pilus assembly protein CpaE
VLAALDVTDRYLLLATPDLPSLANLRLTLDLFDLRGYPAAARLVVLNRADEPTGLALTDVARVIGVPIRARVPSSGDVPISLDRGVPLAVEAPGHPVSRAIRDFAEEFLLAGPAAAPARGLGRLRHLGRRAVPR